MYSKKVQYSPENHIVSIFQTTPFAYSLEHASGKVISTMNRVRWFLEKLWVGAPSKNIVSAVLRETGWSILGKAVNIYGHISTICLLNVEKVRERVEQALKKWELQNTQQSFMPEILKHPA